jgi:Mn2+/Fe2+ NRAMP family transporter
VTRYLNVALGILAAIGGFVDIGDLVFNTAAGATFGYELLWVVPVGVVGIVVYSEMSGRVAAVSGRAVFDVVRERLGLSVGLVALAAAEFVTFMTLAAEIGGVAIALRLLSDLPYETLLVLAVLALFVVLWTAPFEWIERVFGYLGLCLLVFLVGAIKLHPDWSGVASGFMPSIDTSNVWVWAFYVIGLIGAAMTPYEVYFYSSGAVEERWSTRDLSLNRVNAMLGFGLGGVLSLALMIGAAEVLLPAGVSPETLGSTALVASSALGEIGLLLGLVGMTFAIAGAAIDTAFSGAYNLGQFFGWEWGKYRTNAGAPRFTLAWIVLLVLAFGVVATGVDPVLVTEFSVIFSSVALPLTYLPILLVANDAAYMGKHRNGRVANGFGLIYLAIILVISVTAIPVLVLSDMGRG